MPYRLTAAATAHGHGTTIDGVGRCSEARQPGRTMLCGPVFCLPWSMVDLFVRRTQWVVLSAASEHPWCGASRAAPGRGVDGADGAIQPLVTLLSQLLVQRAGQQRAVSATVIVFYRVRET